MPEMSGWPSGVRGGMYVETTGDFVAAALAAVWATATSTDSSVMETEIVSVAIRPPIGFTTSSLPFVTRSRSSPAAGGAHLPAFVFFQKKLTQS